MDYDASQVSARCIWRVFICGLIDADIPRLSFSGIQFDVDCFQWTYSVQSSSNLFSLSSSVDAFGLEYYLSFGSKTPSSTSHVVRNMAEFNALPSNVEDLWIGCFNASEITTTSFNRFQSLKSLVIGNSVFWDAAGLELNNLPSLQSIDIGVKSFFWSPSLSLTGWIDWLV